MTRDTFSVIIQAEREKKHISVEGMPGACVLAIGDSGIELSEEEVGALAQTLESYLATPREGDLVPITSVQARAAALEGSSYTYEHLQALYVRALKDIPAAHPEKSKCAIARWQVYVTDDDTALIIPYSVREPGGIWTEKTHRISLS